VFALSFLDLCPFSPALVGVFPDMMRAMREITKPVFWVVAVSFIGWMAYGQITDIVGGGKDVVLKVDGTVVRSQPFQQQYQATLEQYRRQQGGGRLTREDERQVQDRVAEQFIQKILLERADRRFGITVSDDEIIQAARSAPPPQILQQVLQDATFQTNGQFDITKWQRYISSAGSEFASQVEQLYRDYLPQRKLEEYLTADVYVSDAKLWRIWRDQHESVTVAVLAVRPEDMPDSLVRMSDAELERYYETHQTDFKRPAAAWLSYVAQPRIADAPDTGAALARGGGTQPAGPSCDRPAAVPRLPLARAPKLVQGERLVLAEGPVPDVSVWAFDARLGETSPVIDGPRASYVFRLDSLEPAGVPP